MESPSKKRQKKSHSHSSLLLGVLPREIVRRIANEYLSPKDRLNLSSCCQHLRKAFPLPLMIEIVNKDRSKSIRQRFFVSRPPQKRDLHTNNTKNCYCQDGMLHSHETMHYRQDYIFWNFDYASYSPVYLGRHSRHRYFGTVSPELRSHNFQSFFIALRIGFPSQFWQVVGGSSKVSQRDPVAWGDIVGLMVGGNNPNVGQPDSTNREFLSCFPDITYKNYPNWMALMGAIYDSNERVEWGTYEKLRLNSNQTVARGEAMASTPSSTSAQSLIVTARPDVCDKGKCFLYYDPGRDSIAGRTNSILGGHAVIRFHFWIYCGIMHFLAINLSFSLEIPILNEDGGSYAGLKGTSWGVRPIQILYEIQSKRWDLIVMYMNVAADKLYRYRFNPEKDALVLRFSRCHPDYLVEYREQSKAIHVDVKGKTIRSLNDDGTALSLQFQQPSVWKFVLTC